MAHFASPSCLGCSITTFTRAFFSSSCGFVTSWNIRRFKVSHPCQYPDFKRLNVEASASKARGCRNPAAKGKLSRVTFFSGSPYDQNSSARQTACALTVHKNRCHVVWLHARKSRHAAFCDTCTYFRTLKVSDEAVACPPTNFRVATGSFRIIFYLWHTPFQLLRSNFFRFHINFAYEMNAQTSIWFHFY